MGKKSADNVIKAIEKSERQTWARVIAGLGIRHIGGQSSQILAEHFDSYGALMAADEETLAGIEQIGPVMGKSIREYFDNQLELLEELLKYLNPRQPRTQRTNKLAGKTIVVTGTLENFTHQQIEQAIKDSGGKSSLSVSKKTDFVLAGESPGSKLEKARKLGVKVINEKQFLEMIRD